MPLRSLLFVPAQEPFELISQLQDRAREVDFTARATFVILLGERYTHRSSECFPGASLGDGRGSQVVARAS